MASNVISPNVRVRIDGKGLGIVKECVFRGFDTVYLIKLVDIDFEVELPRERLTVVSDDEPTLQQTPNHPAPSRFDIASFEDVEEFNLQQTNKNTLAKTVYDLKILRAFLNEPEISEFREIEDMPVSDLSQLLCRFLVSVKKQNGDEYEPSCLRGMLSSFDRQLRRKNYGQTIAHGPGFTKVMDTLAMKQRHLKSSGKGNNPHKSEPLNDNDIEQLWKTHQLGVATPDSILQTLWLYTTVHFGLRSCKEHRDMCWGDVVLKRDDNGREYLQFSERQTKTRSGENPRDVRVVKPKLWANETNTDRCPIVVYKKYAEKRPTGYSAPEHPFYIASTTIHHPSPCDVWFKRNPVGVNKLATTMKRMSLNAGLNPHKKLSNHSARKYLVQKLNDNNVPANHIMQISGHKNIHSINNYSHINENQHRQISSVLYSNPSTVESGSNTVQPQNSTSTHVVADSRSAATYNVSGGFHSIFGNQIHGGTFHVNVYQHPETSPARKRTRIMDTDSD